MIPSAPSSRPRTARVPTRRVMRSSSARGEPQALMTPPPLSKATRRTSRTPEHHRRDIQPSSRSAVTTGSGSLTDQLVALATLTAAYSLLEKRGANRSELVTLSRQVRDLRQWQQEEYVMPGGGRDPHPPNARFPSVICDACANEHQEMGTTRSKRNNGTKLSSDPATSRKSRSHTHDIAPLPATKSAHHHHHHNHLNHNDNDSRNHNELPTVRTPTDMNTVRSANRSRSDVSRGAAASSSNGHVLPSAHRSKRDDFSSGSRHGTHFLTDATPESMHHSQHHAQVGGDQQLANNGGSSVVLGYPEEKTASTVLRKNSDESSGADGTNDRTIRSVLFAVNLAESQIRKKIVFKARSHFSQLRVTFAEERAALLEAHATASTAAAYAATAEAAATRSQQRSSDALESVLGRVCSEESVSRDELRSTAMNALSQLKMRQLREGSEMAALASLHRRGELLCAREATERSDMMRIEVSTREMFSTWFRGALTQLVSELRAAQQNRMSEERRQRSLVDACESDSRASLAEDERQKRRIVICAAEEQLNRVVRAAELAQMRALYIRELVGAESGSRGDVVQDERNSRGALLDLQCAVVAVLHTSSKLEGSLQVTPVTAKTPPKDLPTSTALEVPAASLHGEQNDIDNSPNRHRRRQIVAVEASVSSLLSALLWEAAEAHTTACERVRRFSHLEGDESRERRTLLLAEEDSRASSEMLHRQLMNHWQQRQAMIVTHSRGDERILPSETVIQNSPRALDAELTNVAESDSERRSTASTGGVKYRDEKSSSSASSHSNPSGNDRSMDSTTTTTGSTSSASSSDDDKVSARSISRSVEDTDSAKAMSVGSDPPLHDAAEEDVHPSRNGAEMLVAAPEDPVKSAAVRSLETVESESNTEKTVQSEAASEASSSSRSPSLPNTSTTSSRVSSEEPTSRQQENRDGETAPALLNGTPTESSRDASEPLQEEQQDDSEAEVEQGKSSHESSRSTSGDRSEEKLPEKENAIAADADTMKGTIISESENGSVHSAEPDARSSHSISSVSAKSEDEETNERREEAELVLAASQYVLDGLLADAAAAADAHISQPPVAPPVPRLTTGEDSESKTEEDVDHNDENHETEVDIPAHVVDNATVDGAHESQEETQIMSSGSASDTSSRSAASENEGVEEPVESSAQIQSKLSDDDDDVMDPEEATTTTNGSATPHAEEVEEKTVPCISEPEKTATSDEESQNVMEERSLDDSFRQKRMDAWNIVDGFMKASIGEGIVAASEEWIRSGETRQSKTDDEPTAVQSETDDREDEGDENEDEDWTMQEDFKRSPDAVELPSESHGNTEDSFMRENKLQAIQLVFNVADGLVQSGIRDAADQFVQSKANELIESEGERVASETIHEGESTQENAVLPGAHDGGGDDDGDSILATGPVADSEAAEQLNSSQNGDAIQEEIEDDGEIEERRPQSPSSAATPKKGNLEGEEAESGIESISAKLPEGDSEMAVLTAGESLAEPNTSGDDDDSEVMSCGTARSDSSIPAGQSSSDTAQRKEDCLLLVSAADEIIAELIVYAAAASHSSSHMQTAAATTLPIADGDADSSSNTEASESAMPSIGDADGHEGPSEQHPVDVNPQAASPAEPSESREDASVVEPASQPPASPPPAPLNVGSDDVLLERKRSAYKIVNSVASRLIVSAWRNASDRYKLLSLLGGAGDGGGASKSNAPTSKPPAAAAKFDVASVNEAANSILSGWFDDASQALNADRPSGMGLTGAFSLAGSASTASSSASITEGVENVSSVFSDMAAPTEAERSREDAAIVRRITLYLTGRAGADILEAVRSGKTPLCAELVRGTIARGMRAAVCEHLDQSTRGDQGEAEISPTKAALRRSYELCCDAVAEKIALDYTYFLERSLMTAEYDRLISDSVETALKKEPDSNRTRWDNVVAHFAGIPLHTLRFLVQTFVEASRRGQERDLNQGVMKWNVFVSPISADVQTAASEHASQSDAPSLGGGCVRPTLALAPFPHYAPLSIGLDARRARLSDAVLNAALATILDDLVIDTAEWTQRVFFP